MMIRIRPAADPDRAAIAAVQAESWRDVYRGILSDRYLDEEMDDDLAQRWEEERIGPRDVVLVAEEGGRLIGLISVWADDDAPEAFIDNFHVLPARRSGGIGAALLRSAALTLLEKGIAAATLTVAEANPRALAFYQRQGGAVIGRGMEPLGDGEVPAIRIGWPDLKVFCKP